LLTEEFLGMPVRLERIEQDVAVLKADVTVLKTDVAELKGSVASLNSDMEQVKTDIGSLKGFALESLLHRRIRPIINQRFRLRSTRIMQSSAQEPLSDLTTPVEASVDAGVITTQRAIRVDATDLILRAQRRETLQYVWVAVEASNKVREGDIERSRETADILARVFEEESIAVVAGHSIDPPDLQRARAADVVYVELEERW
jgi:hypothetical protein